MQRIIIVIIAVMLAFGLIGCEKLKFWEKPPVKEVAADPCAELASAKAKFAAAKVELLAAQKKCPPAKTPPPVVAKKADPCPKCPPETEKVAAPPPAPPVKALTAEPPAPNREVKIGVKMFYWSPEKSPRDQAREMKGGVVPGEHQINLYFYKKGVLAKSVALKVKNGVSETTSFAFKEGDEFYIDAEAPKIGYGYAWPNTGTGILRAYHTQERPLDFSKGPAWFTYVIHATPPAPPTPATPPPPPAKKGSSWLPWGN